MKKKVIVGILAMVLVVSCTGCFKKKVTDPFEEYTGTPTGFSNLTWGMSPEEVIAAENLNTRALETTVYGFTAVYRSIPNDIVGINEKMKLSKLYSVVEFEFYEEKLYEIKITYPDKMATEDDYRNLVSKLAEQYEVNGEIGEPEISSSLDVTVYTDFKMDEKNELAMKFSKDRYSSDGFIFKLTQSDIYRFVTGKNINRMTRW